MQRNNSTPRPILVKLLDSVRGHALHTWNFEGVGRITIGRASENDISVADPTVSRLHAEMLIKEGQWVLVSRGRYGTLVSGEQVDETVLDEFAIFQLGANGPSFQFSYSTETGANTATVQGFDPQDFQHLMINRQAAEQEVTEIVDSEAFRELQAQVRKLRDKSE